MIKLKEKMKEALVLKYKAEIAKCESTLMIYFNNSVGIGEHPQHLEEMDKLVDELTNAKDKLKTIESFYESLSL